MSASAALAVEPAGRPPAAAPARAPSGRPRERGVLLRALPIRWRLIALAVLNTAAVLVLAGVVYDGARRVGVAWDELGRARAADQLLVSVNADIARVQSLIHRYFTQPNPAVLDDINRRRADLLGRLRGAALAGDAGDVSELRSRAEQFLGGFDQLKEARTALVAAYERDVLKPAREMAGLYGVLDSATQNPASLVWPALGRSRESFNNALVSANAFYLSQELRAAAETREALANIRDTVPFMLDLSENELQRIALDALSQRVASVTAGFNRLAAGFAAQNDLLRTAVDGNQSALAAAIGRLSRELRETEERARDGFDAALREVYGRLAAAGLGFMLASILLGVAISRSISRPLSHLRETMTSIAAGNPERRVTDLDASDEVGEMARTVEVFRHDAIARRRAEQELRAAKERAEAALLELRDAQATLIQTEKFAALGSLVAGVAHEVNNPVGIGLTVASTLVRRSERFADELDANQVRKSSLAEFVAGTRDAAHQLVANLTRAAELVQSFKQVAVDRSHADRRSFDLAVTTRQIAASLQPGARRRHVILEVDVPPGILLDSFPGPYGQVLTNLYLNAINHAYADAPEGDERQNPVRVTARRLGASEVEITVADQGRGMAPDVLAKAFEPFFTTRRSEGGTGLGLHIVYNLVHHRLGGRIAVQSREGGGTTFRIVLPLVAPGAEPRRAVPAEAVPVV